MDELYKFAKKAEKENELEIRFKDIDTREGISYESFSRIAKYLKKNKNLWKKKQTSQDDVLYGSENIRKISTPKGSYYEKKKRVRVLDSDEYKLRISEAKEIPVNNSNITWNDNTVTVTRKRDRITYTNGDVNIDLTKIIQNSLEKKESSILFECEIEYLNIPNNETIFSNLILTVLKLIQNATKLFTIKQHQQISKNYAKLLSNDMRFPGSIPRALTSEVLEKRLNNNYAVTLKADGIRKLLFISNSNESFFVGRPKVQFNTKFEYIGTSPMGNTLLDGEFLESENIYMIFDVLIYSGEDVRELDLKSRINKLTDINDIGETKLVMKDYEYYDVGANAQMLWNDRGKLYPQAKFDGLIFTPIDLPYFNKHIFKWKNHHTIDLEITRKKDKTWKLSIAGFSRRGNYTTFNFQGEFGDGKFIFNKKGDSKINLLMGKLADVYEPTDTQFNDISDGAIVEFKINHSNDKLSVPRVREDKLFPNNILSVNDAWTARTENIDIKTFEKVKIRSGLRVYHNKIKDYFVKKYMVGRSIFDIGSGAGGDYMKYKKHKVKKVFAVDIKQMDYEVNANDSKWYKFFKLPDKNWTIQKIQMKNPSMKQEQSFDVVVCHFAFHYFWEDMKYFNNFIEAVYKMLKPGGIFIVTFLDGEQILNIMNQYSINELKQSGVYSIKITDSIEDIVSGNPFEKKIDVWLSGTKYFDNKQPKKKVENKRVYSHEYLVFPHYFINHTQKWLEVVEGGTFNDFCNKNNKSKYMEECLHMIQEEKEYSFFNGYLVMKKKKTQ